LSVDVSADARFPICRVLLVGPTPPPYGGMAFQARLLEKMLVSDGHQVFFLPANPPLPQGFGWLARVPGLRTVARAMSIWVRFWRASRHVDVVHVLAASWVYFWTVVYPAVLMGRMRRKRVVVNYRGGEAGEFFRRWGWAIQPAFQLADAITVPSDFLGEMIRNRFPVPVRIVPNILNNSEFRYRQRTRIEPKLLVTRHLEKIYDVESVLKAFGLVQEQYPEASLWIAGTGSQQEQLRGQASDWGLRNVRFLGFVAHEDLPKICDQCDILINASRVDNFPGALMEGSAAGLVVVSTRAGGISVMYQHEKTALLVEPGDWRGLGLSVIKVLQSPSLATDLATRAGLMVRKCEWPEVRKPLYGAYGLAPELKADMENSCEPAGSHAGGTGRWKHEG
jgi:glycosyltransferase involved in cell wall biosynthesis